MDFSPAPAPGTRSLSKGITPLLLTNVMNKTNKRTKSVELSRFMVFTMTFMMYKGQGNLHHSLPSSLIYYWSEQSAYAALWHCRQNLDAILTMFSRRREFSHTFQTCIQIKLNESLIKRTLVQLIFSYTA